MVSSDCKDRRFSVLFSTVAGARDALKVRRASHSRSLARNSGLMANKEQTIN